MPVIIWHDGGAPVTTSFTSNINFGQHSFLGTPPAGFKILSSANLPDAAIKKGTDYFNSVLYTGNGSTQSITGVGFQPNFTWVKKRNSTSNNLTDSVSGTGKELNSNNTNAQGTNANGITAFGADGFSVGTDGGVNGNTDTFVGWNWQESASAGFDILSWTGNGANRTIAHNLGVAPEMVIVKRTDDSAHWAVWHKNLADGTKWLAFNLTNAEDTESTYGIQQFQLLQLLILAQIQLLMLVQVLILLMYLQV